MRRDPGPEVILPDNDFQAFVLDQLSGVPDVVTRRMFGAYGLYAGETFFGILHQGRLYFKTRPETVEHYRAYGMTPFQPTPKQTLKHYYEVPVAILEDAEALCRWAQEACRDSARPK